MAESVREISEFVASQRQTIGKRYVARTFIHGEGLEPIEDLREAKLNPDLQTNLSKRGFHLITRTQSHALKAIGELNSAVIVGNEKSGKTFSYLLPVLSYLLDHDSSEELEDDLCYTPGPTVLVVSTAKDIEVAYKNYLNLLEANRLKVVTSQFLLQENSSKRLENLIVCMLNGCDLLFITPGKFSKLLKSGSLKLFDKKKIKSVVFDNMDAIIDNYSEEIKEILKVCMSQQPKENPQLIITSTIWRNEYRKFLSLMCCPLVIIDSKIEAAIYANSQFIVERMDHEAKDERLLKIVNSGEFKCKKTLIVVGNELDAENLSMLFEKSSIKVKRMISKIKWSPEEIESFHNLHESEPNGSKSLLLATDKQLQDYNLDYIQVLIHYSLPSKWSEFVDRFNACLHYYENYVKLSEKNEANLPKTYILMDFQNCTEAARLLNFLKERRIIADIPDNLVALFNQAKVLENQKADATQQVCSNILKFGECKNRKCSHRHVFVKEDKFKDIFPVNGLVKFKIVKIFSPVHYGIKILKHQIDANGWKIWKNQNEMIEQKIEDLQDYMKKYENRVIQTSVSVGDICAYHLKTKWYRAKVLLKSNEENAKPSVQILLIDCGLQLNTFSKFLMKLPDEFKLCEPLFYNLRIPNLTSFEKDLFFDEEITSELENIFKEMNDSDYFACKTELAISNTIYTQEFLMLKYMKNLEEMTKKFSLKQFMMSNEYATVVAQNLKNIKHLANVCGQSDSDIDDIIKCDTEQEEASLKLQQLDVCKHYNAKLLFIKSPSEMYMQVQGTDQDIKTALATADQYEYRFQVDKVLTDGTPCLYVENEKAFRAIVTDAAQMKILLIDVGEIKICSRKNDSIYKIPNHISSISSNVAKCMLRGVRIKNGSNIFPKRGHLPYTSYMNEIRAGTSFEIKACAKENKILIFIETDENEENLLLDHNALSPLMDDDQHLENSIQNDCYLELFETDELFEMLGLKFDSNNNNNVVNNQHAIAEISPTKILALPAKSGKQTSLEYIYKRPSIEWKQNEAIVSLKIVSTDAENYFLELTQSAITVGLLSTLSKMKINLYAEIQPDLVYHEKKGNVIYIKMLKNNVYRKWPRLIRHPDDKFDSIMQTVDDFDGAATQKFISKNLPEHFVEDIHSDSTYDDDLQDENMM